MSYSNLSSKELSALMKTCKAEAAKYQSIAAKCQKEIKRRKRSANKQLENDNVTKDSGIPIPQT